MLDLLPSGTESSDLGPVPLLIGLGLALVGAIIVWRVAGKGSGHRLDHDPFAEAVMRVYRGEDSGLAAGPELTWAEVKKEIVASLAEELPSSDTTAIEQRLTAVEERFPEATAIEKYATSNDVIMSMQLKHLEQALAELKQGSVTKWVVVQISVGVLTFFMGVAGLVVAVLEYLK